MASFMEVANQQRFYITDNNYDILMTELLLGGDRLIEVRL